MGILYFNHKQDYLMVILDIYLLFFFHFTQDSNLHTYTHSGTSCSLANWQPGTIDHIHICFFNFNYFFKKILRNSKIQNRLDQVGNVGQWAWWPHQTVRCYPLVNGKIHFHICQNHYFHMDKSTSNSFKCICIFWIVLNTRTIWFSFVPLLLKEKKMPYHCELSHHHNMIHLLFT